MSAYRPTFVSHAHADNELCDRYVAALVKRGIPLWYDRNNAQSGHFLGNEIQRELERRSAFVLLLTQHALDSFWVDLETQSWLGLMARDRSRMLLPVRIGACDVPAMLNAFLWIDGLALSFEATIDATAAALVTTADAPAAPPPYIAPPPISALPDRPGPAPMPANARPAHHLTPMSLYNLGFRGWNVGGVECVLPPICPVPGGVFTMGSDKTYDKQAYDDETPQYPVPVGDFSIGQHPVTVAEYACAVRAKAVREPPKWRETDWSAQLKRMEHPVVCVSWQDARAYTRWLAGVTRQVWRLPTEAEWEKMARWDAATRTARVYPWGDAFDKARCNTSESGVGATTPVGRYPNGASPYGAQDVAGNVWEWTSSLIMPYAYNQSDGREDQDATGNRALRGGSWGGGVRDARAALRGVDWLDNFLDGNGFRLLLAPARAGS
ncbi:MAG TPA: SUMF1/EgtB/PvdO family nonheme iron enzyme [Ktedonobacterales bacterium]|nr:SUMF1/EgtB/PvdO family nonheme iron enzyme [Ktedonobacterales bacterium]